jgi:predicted molibdopterin-dependent oxidoreductase YjgC
MSLGAGRASQVTKVRSTCSYCGVGCNFDLNVRDGKIVRVTSAEDAPVNGMALCVKGRYGYDYVHHPDRLTRPLVRAKWLGPERVEERVASGEWQVTVVAEKRIQFSPDGVDAITADSFIQTDWDSALNVVADKFAEEKQAHGGEAFAVLASAKCTNEENFLFNKFTRQVLGTNSIDHCARL